MGTKEQMWNAHWPEVQTNCGTRKIISLPYPEKLQTSGGEAREDISLLFPPQQSDLMSLDNYAQTLEDQRKIN